MVNVTKENRGKTLVIKIVGSIEETVDFDELFGPPPEDMEINCKEVPRINSVGVKGWIRYFQNCRAKGTNLHFVECSTAIVEQINLISNFTCGGSVDSIFVPFSCSKCKSELVGLFKTADLKRIEFKLPDLKCTKCGGAATFDDIPDEFFSFLMR